MSLPNILIACLHKLTMSFKQGLALKEGTMWRVGAGGGGNIKIKRIELTKNDYIMHMINSIEGCLSQNDVGIIIKNMVEYGIVSSETAKLIRVATNDKVLNLPNELKDEVRTRIFKNMLINLI